MLCWDFIVFSFQSGCSVDLTMLTMYGITHTTSAASHLIVPSFLQVTASDGLGRHASARSHIFMIPGDACHVTVDGGGAVQTRQDQGITGTVHDGGSAAWIQVFASTSVPDAHTSMSLDGIMRGAHVSGTATLVVPGALLPERQVYTMRLEGHSGWSEVSMWTRGTPLGGSVTVTPSSGYGGLTEFELAAHGWQDEQDALPLYYTYSHVTEERMRLPYAEATSRHTFSSVVLPATRMQRKAFVTATVCNSHGLCAEASAAEVQVLPLGAHEAPAAVIRANELLRRAKALGSTEAVLQASVAICSIPELENEVEAILGVVHAGLQASTLDMYSALFALQLCAAADGNKPVQTLLMERRAGKTTFSCCEYTSMHISKYFECLLDAMFVKTLCVSMHVL
jgi:hypothetical protein